MKEANENPVMEASSSSASAMGSAAFQRGTLGGFLNWGT